MMKILDPARENEDNTTKKLYIYMEKVTDIILNRSTLFYGHIIYVRS